MSIQGADDIDYLRALWFMLDDAQGMANESTLPAPHFERKMCELMVDGLVYRRPLSGALVWTLTPLAEDIVKRELELEDRHERERHAAAG